MHFSAAAGADVGGVASAAAAKFSQGSSLLNLVGEMTVELNFENSAAGAGMGGGASVFF